MFEPHIMWHKVRFGLRDDLAKDDAPHSPDLKIVGVFLNGKPLATLNASEADMTMHRRMFPAQGFKIQPVLQ